MLDETNLDLYITSFYFTVTTIMTVGYGDILAMNMMERILCIILMIIGVITFSIATSAITSIITHSEKANERLKHNMAILFEL